MCRHPDAGIAPYDLAIGAHERLQELDPDHELLEFVSGDGTVDLEGVRRRVYRGDGHLDDNGAYRMYVTEVRRVVASILYG